MVKSIGLTINSPYSVSVDAASKSHHHFRQWWLYGGHLGPQQTPRRWSSTIILIRGLWFYDPTASILSVLVCLPLATSTAKGIQISKNSLFQEVCEPSHPGDQPNSDFNLGQKDTRRKEKIGSRPEATSVWNPVRKTSDRIKGGSRVDANNPSSFIILRWTYLNEQNSFYHHNF